MLSVVQVFFDKRAWQMSRCKELRWAVPPPGLAASNAQTPTPEEGVRAYRRILVVDDSISSGKTMRNCINFVQAAFPLADVRTFVLYAPEQSSGIDDKVSFLPS
jgi:hypothetical protein